jgi:bis(5'-adenosyl)-triphosphatase
MLLSLTLTADMLVASHRPAERVTDLTPAEVSDLFRLVQKVSDVTQKLFQATSVTVAIQDGSDAGQTVKVQYSHAAQSLFCKETVYACEAFIV